MNRFFKFFVAYLTTNLDLNIVKKMCFLPLNKVEIIPENSLSDVKNSTVETDDFFGNSLFSSVLTIIYISMSVLNILHGLEILTPISETGTGNYYI